MFKLLYLSFFVLQSLLVFTQNYAPKKYYLVDSLNFARINKYDRQLIDSCLNLYHKSKSDTSKVNFIEFIIDNCYNEDVWPKYNNFVYNFIEAMLKNQQSKAITLKLKNSLATAIHNFGYFYDGQGNLSKALEYHLKSLKIREEIGINSEIATSLNYLGLFHKNHGNIKEALEYYHKSLKISEKIVDKEGVGTTLNNIGVIYMLQDNISLSLDYFKKSLKIRQEIDFKKGIAESFNNIGYLYHYYGDPHCHSKKDTCLTEGKIKALDYYQKSLKIREEIKEKKGIAMSLNNIGAIYDIIGDPICKSSYEKRIEKGHYKAIEYYKRSLKLREEIDDKIGVAISYNNLGGVYLKLGDNNKAKALIIRSLMISRKIGYPENIRNSSSLLSGIYEKENNGMQALEMYKLHISMRDSINNISTQKASVRQQAKYEYEKQAATDSISHKKAMEIKDLKVAKIEEEKEKQKVVIYSFVVVFIVIIVFSALLYRLFIQKKKANILLAHKNIEVEQKNEEITAQRDEITAQRDLVTRQKNEIEHIHDELTDSINYAKRIQQAVLPNLEQLLAADNQTEVRSPKTEVASGFRLPTSDYFVLFRPKDIVSGDFYWFANINDKVIIAVADCTGHGVPGAFMSMLGISFLNEIIRKKEILNANEILNELRKEIINALQQKGQSGEQKDGMDLVLVVINTNNLEMQFAGANNSLWIVNKVESYKVESYKVESNKVESNKVDDNSLQTLQTLQTNDFTNFELYELKGDKMPVAIHERMDSFTNHVIQLQKGDTLYFASDGYEDQFGGPRQKKFLSKNLKQLLTANCQKPMTDQKQVLETTLIEWIGNGEQIDDITVLGIKI